MEISGGLVHEFMVCPRAAWYSYRYVSFENELLILGRMIYEKSYKGEVKNVFGDNISLDFVRKEKGEVEIYEVKKSSKMLHAAEMQLAFYLKWLKDRGVIAKGKIVVPEERFSKEVVLTEEIEKELDSILQKLAELLEKKRPPKPKWKNVCEKCSYHDFCWV